MSLPRELSLRRSGNLLLLAQVPVRELRALRSNGRPLKRVALRVGFDAELGPLQAASEVEVTLDVGSAREAGLMIRQGRDEETLAGYDAHAHELFVDRTRSGHTDFDPSFATRQHTPLPLHNGLLHLDIVQDRSSIEVFAENGLKVPTFLVFPSRPDARLHAYATGGRAAVVGGTSWDLAGSASQ
jgi:sucrose-6-phosphate hydrolase SacC (GH32 family)